MQRSKKVFLGLAVIFLGIVGGIGYDFARRTTFPGSRPQLQERIKKQFLQKDEKKTPNDSLEAPPKPATGDSTASFRR